MKPFLAAHAQLRRWPDPLHPMGVVAVGSDGHRFHFPGAAVLPDGTWLAAAREGVEHVDHTGRLVLCRSEDEGETWSAPEVVWDSPTDDRDPKLSVDDDGTVHLLYFNLAHDGSTPDVTLGVHTMRSTDGGRHFEPPVRVGTRTACHGTVVAMPDGSLLAPVYGRGRSGVARSLDGGRTWPAEQETLFDIAPLRTNEVTLLRLLDGTVVAWLRAAREGERSVVLRSTDSGHTWSEPQLSNLRQSSADAILLDDGRVLVAFGDRSRRFGERRVTCAGIIDDPLRSWEVSTLVPVWDACNNDQANPALIPTGDGAAVVVTDYASRTLVLQRLTTRDLDGAPTDAAQFEGAVDLLELVSAGRATLSTDLVAGPVGTTAAEALLTHRLGLDGQLLGDPEQTSGHATLTFAEPLEVGEIGVALRPGEEQGARVEILVEGAWQHAGRLVHGWRFGDIDWLPLDGRTAVTGIRVTTTASTNERPPNSGRTPALVLSQLAVR